MTDLTAWVQARIDATPDGGTIDLGGQLFQVDGTLRFDGRKGLTVANATFAAANLYDETRTDFTVAERGRCQISIDKGPGNVPSEDLKFVNVHTEGSNRNWVSSYAIPGQGLEGQAGFAIGYAKRVEFDHCSAQWTYGDAFSILGGRIQDVGHPPAEDIWIHDSQGLHIGRIGFYHTCVRRSVFERNELRWVHRPWTHSEPNFLDSVVEDVWIQDNTLQDIQNAAYWTGGKPTNAPIQRIIVRRNRGVGVGVSGNFGLPVGTSTTPFPRRQFFYWLDNVSGGPAEVSCNEANYVMVRGTPVKLFRCCGVRADQIILQEPCNLTGPFVAPIDVPAMPSAWPYPFEVNMAYPPSSSDPAIQSIVAELGQNPSGFDPDVQTRLVRQAVKIEDVRALIDAVRSDLTGESAIRVSADETVNSRVASLEAALIDERAARDAAIAQAIADLRTDFAS